MFCDVRAARAGKSRNPLFFVARIHLEQLGNGDNAFGSVDVALAGGDCALNAFFSEHTASGESAAAAIGVWKERLDLRDPRVFPNVELLVRDSEQSCQQDAHAAHHCTGYEEFHHDDKARMGEIPQTKPAPERWPV